MTKIRRGRAKVKDCFHQKSLSSCGQWNDCYYPVIRHYKRFQEIQYNSLRGGWEILGDCLKYKSTNHPVTFPRTLNRQVGWNYVILIKPFNWKLIKQRIGQQWISTAPLHPFPCILIQNRKVGKMNKIFQIGSKP